MSRGRLLLAIVVAIAVGLAVLVVDARRGRRLEDRTSAPELAATALVSVVDLDWPPGNIAVAANGRVFFTYHPDGDPPAQVMELVDGKPQPFPRTPVEPAYQTVLALRIDRQNRLWALDHAGYGRGQPRLLAFDLATDRLVHRYDVPSDVAGLGSMLNDFQVDPAGETVYIAEASPILGRPALIVYDAVRGTSRRLLERHPSVMPEDFILRGGDRDMYVFGLVPLRIGVDSIALDRRGEWLYYGPVNGDRMYRVATRDLRDPRLPPDALARKVEDWAPKTLSDGLSSDDAGRVYVTDPEHSAVLAIEPDRRLRTLVKDPRLRWPDGLSFGPDGWLWVTCSALQDVLFRSASARREHAPYHIWRFQPGATATPGH
jgi:sugar lactone lactonase YvrE